MNRGARLLTIALLLWAGVLQAASGSVEMRLRALESRLPDADRMAALEKAVNSQGSAVLAGEVEQLKTEIRELRGQIEQLTHQIQKQQQNQGLLYGDLDKRLQALEAKAAAMPPATQPQAGAGATAAAATGDVAGLAGPGPASSGQEQSEYLAAFELLQQGKTNEAVVAFQGFLAKYPQGAYAGNALYWLGEAHYVNKNYTESMADFQKLVERYPDSQKLSGALLKIGYIHYETRNYAEARAVLEKVKNGYPDSNVGALAAERLERMRKEGV
jgi:tol-pal system protein YbgF